MTKLEKSLLWAFFRRFNSNKTCSLLSLAAHASPFPNQETVHILEVPGHHPWCWRSSGGKVSRYPCTHIGHEEGKVRIRREKPRLTSNKSWTKVYSTRVRRAE